VSIDGGGPILGIDFEVPSGSEIDVAYLYCATTQAPAAPPGSAPTVVLGGVTYGPAEFVPLPWLQFPGYPTGMQAFRADATSQIAGLVAGGAAGSTHLDIASAATPVGRTTGQVLVVVYRNASAERRWIALFDGAVGFSDTTLQTSLPERREHPGATSRLSVAIGFSTGSGDQKTILEVNGRRLTSIAGGADDHSDLMTAGGLGDDPANPPDPYASPLTAGALDDELYDLSQGNALVAEPFVGLSEGALVVTSANASEDDHVFFAALDFSLGPEPPIVEIPTLDPIGLLLLALGLALAALGAARHRRARR